MSLASLEHWLDTGETPDDTGHDLASMDDVRERFGDAALDADVEDYLDTDDAALERMWANEKEPMPIPCDDCPGEECEGCGGTGYWLPENEGDWWRP